MTDALNRLYTYAYNTQGLMTSETDPLNHTTSYGYDLLNRLITLTNALNQITTYAYDSAGDLTSTTDARGFTNTYSYDTLGRKTGETLADSNTLNSVYTYSYDGVGNQTGATGPLSGQITQYGYDALNRLTSTISPVIGLSTIGYDANGNETSATNPLGEATRYSYDAANRQTTTMDAMGQMTTIGYDAAGQQITLTNPLNQTTTNAYTLRGQLASTTDPLGDVMNYSYNAAGDTLSVSQTGPGSPTETTSTLYNALHQQTATYDALNHQTTYGYDAAGNQTTVTDPLGHVLTYSYDALNRVSSTKDALGNTTTYGFDAVGNQISATDPLGHATTSTYDAQGRALTQTDARGGITSNTYDLVGNQITMTDPAGDVMNYSYDAANRMTQTTDPLGHVTTTAYDQANQLISTTDANNHATTIGYDRDGRQTSSTDALGNVTSNTYDVIGQLTATTDANGHVTSFTYDAAGRQKSETDADGNTTRYTFDSFGNVLTTTDQLGNTTTSIYNLNNQVTSTTDADGRKITYAYDNNGRLQTETWFNADSTVQNTKTYTYDNNDRLLTASDNSGTYTMTYDNNGRLSTRTDEGGRTLTYGYDNNDNVTSIQDSLGGTLTNVYDSANRLTSKQFTNGTTQARMDLTYTLAGQLATLTRYKDTAGTQLVGKSAYTFDFAGNTTEIKHTNATNGVQGDYQYAFDSANRLSSETDTQSGNPPVTTTYTYDKASQLTQAGSKNYGYDPNGNQNTTGYSTGPGNRLQSDGTWNYTYDNAGNTITKTNIATGEVWTYSWDDANHLTQATDKDVHGSLIQQITFKYDVFGQKIEEDVYTQATGLTATTKYAYDAEGNIWADLNASNQLVDRRLFVDVNGQTQPFARIDASGNESWYLTDHLGSIRLLTDNTGAVIDQIDYDAYGNIANETNPANGDRYKFAGMQFDSAMGDYDDKARRVNPSNARFETQDPTGLGPDSNPYRDVGNNPTNDLDPTGTVIVRGNKYGDWEVTYRNINASTATKGLWKSNVVIKFKPNRDEVNSTEISFVQIVRVIDGTTLKYVDPDKVIRARATRDHFSVDRVGNMKYGWYGYNNDGKTNPRLIIPGRSPRNLRDATLFDSPQWDRFNTRFEFETVAIAKSGPDAGTIYGALDWGVYADSKGVVTDYGPIFVSTPHDYWINAGKAWNIQAKGDPVFGPRNRNHKEQQQLGPFQGINVRAPENAGPPWNPTGFYLPWS